MERQFVGGKSYTVRREECMGCLKSALQEFGIKIGGRREAAQEAGRRRIRIANGAETFMQRWHDSGSRAEVRCTKIATR